MRGGEGNSHKHLGHEFAVFFSHGKLRIDLKRKDIIQILETKSCSGVMLFFFGSIPEFAKYVSI